MAEVGRPTELSNKEFGKIVQRLRLIELANVGSSWKRRASSTAKLKKIPKDKCVVCGETRGLDLCHLLPFSLVHKLEEYEYLADSPKNIEIMCKSHHWYYDHNLLTKEELDSLYCNIKHDSLEMLLHFANSKIKKSAAMAEDRDYIILSRYQKWMDWFAPNFFQKHV